MACPELPKLQQRLCEAEDAAHDIALGKGARVVVDHNGERIEYNHTSLKSLRGYISQLKNDIAICEGSKSIYKAIVPWGAC